MGAAAGDDEFMNARTTPGRRAPCLTSCRWP